MFYADGSTFKGEWRNDEKVRGVLVLTNDTKNYA
jgi:hypothetical protein